MYDQTPLEDPIIKHYLETTNHSDANVKSHIGGVIQESDGHMNKTLYR